MPAETTSGVEPVRTARPAIQFYPYQQRWIDDRSRLKIGNKARQIGFSFASAYEVVEDCLVQRPDTKMWPNKWYCLSTGERQAAELIETSQKHAKAFGAAVKVISDDFVWEGERFKSLTIELPTGGRIIGLPANPRTARGSTGNLLLDEYAHHQDPRGIHRAVVPIITRGFKVRIQSTPAGKQGKFYEIWTHGNGWSRHQVDIYQAVEQGLEVDLEELREAVGDDDDWAQEYECKFLDEAHAWLAYDLIDGNEDAAATLELPDGFKRVGPCWLGVDIGRTRDLTVLWLNEQLVDVHWTRMVRPMARTPFRDQMAAIEDVMPLVRRCCIDKGVMGLPLFESLERRWGKGRVEGVQFHAHVKEDLATKIRTAFEDRRCRIPHDKDIRQDLHSVKKITTSAGNVRFDADHSDKGHADRFWACSLALNAASNAVEPLTVDVVERSNVHGLRDQFGAAGDQFDDDDDDGYSDWIRRG